MELYLGIDFGTSGARAIAIDESGKIYAQTSYKWETEAASLAESWQTALFAIITQIPTQVRQQVKAIAIDGTSATVLLCDSAGVPLTKPILYSDAQAVAVIEKLKTLAPANHIVISATSSLAKLLWWLQCSDIVSGNSTYFLHQADWLAFLLHGKLGISDYHNALKLGYDPEKLCYPDWIYQIENLPNLPEIVEPGTPIGEVMNATSLGLPRDCIVCMGTTDSIAAFLAAGARTPGEAVTSLGSTLVLKLLSRVRVDDARYGIYSHRLGNLWLTGGASNTGGAVLRQFFTDEQLAKLSEKISAEQESRFDYYPLIKPGERFPINDANLLPRLSPRPADDVEFLHGLLESIARIEARGYQLLQELGATQLTKVYTAGGGAKNPAWNAIRQRILKVPVEKSSHTEAAYGTALLAMRGIKKNSISLPIL
ncbi:MAG: FGGY-family carbohydrate kinase [Oscillatoriaceae bacterium SKW80]|nr:FGGY-family carbohydrate kinase [Oscillatoriaceae bacterium SKYG93]MCX8119486.1 FGGY-family carbohydrate kinase [Oscillatoriaceae bacterium SKW80]MDW8454953.1 FGGY-family carbohydrate kinase [Oscillatoriaceae cyanobacterium SKYGB_i_bin93]HIK28268.1 FGGY-family carbohydrate kinase [Oscillatoriaceae cyanobacterium M7585_C2015_266]